MFSLSLLYIMIEIVAASGGRPLLRPHHQATDEERNKSLHVFQKYETGKALWIVDNQPDLETLIFFVLVVVVVILFFFLSFFPSGPPLLFYCRDVIVMFN